MIFDKPLKLPCGVILRNRIVKAAMSEQLADALHAPSPELIALYRHWADCGAAVLITGNVMVARDAVSEPGQVVIEDDCHGAALGRWATAASTGGASAWMQINHAGRQVPRLLDNRPAAPSSVGMNNRLLFARPRALGEDEVAALVRAYARAAACAVHAGFGGVQVHAAHGYLASQFLSPFTNRRRDHWGGDANARRTFLLEVISAIRAAIGPQAVLSVKLNASDFRRGGISQQDSLDTIAALSASEVDVLEISGGTFESAAMLGVPSGTGNGPPAESEAREAYFLEFARSARTRFDRPLMVTGGFRSRGAIEAALRSGVVDLVGMARPFVRHPNLLSGPASGDAIDARSKLDLRRPLGLRSGLCGGLSEIAWYTVQIWRRANGETINHDLGAYAAMARYLARQNAQIRARRRVTKCIRPDAGT